ncbi:putative methyltransferase C9orf114 homolog [Drosophila eugracilis]|uniref:putative methyltransferase C9orf114 homolog n=1 Tax=Drosophila eugracilis TaxID=29029 RepID=UPI0007E81130|nr:putative methyltransferase C9orf114 homolog [Drosophila eugracilis]
MPAAHAASSNGKPTEQHKSWKKVNEERKALKRQRKQDKVLKELQQAKEAETKAEQAANEAQSKNQPYPSTLSIAVPGSILENAQSAELRAYVAGQIARAACIFRVNEVIVFDDVGIATARETKRSYEPDAEGSGTGTVRSSSLQLARILQYLECPQYLRKYFFPLHKDLKYSGLLNPLDTPHHLRQQSKFRYREGVICDKKAKEGHSYANVGLLNDVLVDKAIEPGVRVTVKMEPQSENSRRQRGTLVSPDEPRRETGVYWGYQVRIAHSLSEIFTKSPYESGYDLTLGTSDRGTNVHEVPNRSYSFKHMLIVFGGLQGLESALANDEKLTVDDPELLFDHYVNVLPRQGSRTIRTEEALLIALAALQEKLQPAVADVETDLSDLLPKSEDTGIAVRRDVLVSKKQKKRKAVDETSVTPVEIEPTPPKLLPKVARKTANPFGEPPEKSLDKTTIVDDDFEVVTSTTIPGTKQSSGNDDLSRFD